MNYAFKAAAYPALNVSETSSQEYKPKIGNWLKNLATAVRPLNKIMNISLLFCNGWLAACWLPFFSYNWSECSFSWYHKAHEQRVHDKMVAPWRISFVVDLWQYLFIIMLILTAFTPPHFLMYCASTILYNLATKKWFSRECICSLPQIFRTIILGFDYNISIAIMYFVCIDNLCYLQAFCIPIYIIFCAVHIHNASLCCLNRSTLSIRWYVLWHAIHQSKKVCSEAYDTTPI